MSAANNFDKRVDLVLEGGGVKGIALVGALATLEKHGYIPQNVAGSSAGAIVATLLAAGYDAKSLEDTLRTEKFELYLGWKGGVRSLIRGCGSVNDGVYRQSTEETATHP